MTFYHFINCLLLTYTPYYLVYRFTTVYEYAALGKCFFAGAFYILTAAFKLMVLGSLVPFAFPAEDEQSSLLQAIVRFIFDLSDVAALYYVVLKFQRPLKILVPALGWAATESIVTRFLLLFVGARATEFEWTYIQTSIEANVDLLHYITLTTLLFLLSRNDLPKTLVPLLVSLLLLSRMDVIFIKLLEYFVFIGSWQSLAIKIISAVSLAFVTRTIYSSSSTFLKRHD